MPEQPPASQSSQRERGLAAPSAWQPTLDRRQSWNKQDQKHALQIRELQGKTAQGFTEKSSCPPAG